MSTGMRYITELVDNADGTATHGYAFFVDANGARRSIGITNDYREYPRMVRARTAAEALCRLHAKKHFPLHTFTIEKES